MKGRLGAPSWVKPTSVPDHQLINPLGEALRYYLLAHTDPRPICIINDYAKPIRGYNVLLWLKPG